MESSQQSIILDNINIIVRVGFHTYIKFNIIIIDRLKFNNILIKNK